jgi:REP-associated tyrosine transposase
VCLITAQTIPKIYGQRMAHTLSRNLVHCVFSTDGRLDLIPDPERLCQYLCGIARAKNIPILAVGGTKNHLHMLIALPPALPLSKVIQDLKGNTSRWLGEIGQKFAWQRGYGAFSVSESKREQVIAYIAGQEEHHRKWTFEQEYLTLLQKSGITCGLEDVFG